MEDKIGHVEDKIGHVEAQLEPIKADLSNHITDTNAKIEKLGDRG